MTLDQPDDLFSNTARLRVDILSSISRNNSSPRNVIVRPVLMKAATEKWVQPFHCVPSFRVMDRSAPDRKQTLGLNLPSNHPPLVASYHQSQRFFRASRIDSLLLSSWAWDAR